jgi:hypothetical protein
VHKDLIMNLQQTDSLSTRRLSIILTIIPYTIYVAFLGARQGIRGLWTSAAQQWRKR